MELFFGATSRTLFSRPKEHKDNLNKGDVERPLWLHCEKIHSETIVDFNVEIVKINRSNFNSEIIEGVLIANDKHTFKINMKQKFNGTRIQKLRVEVNCNLVENNNNSKNGIEKDIKTINKNPRSNYESIRDYGKATVPRNKTEVSNAM